MHPNKTQRLKIQTIASMFLAWCYLMHASSLCGQTSETTTLDIQKEGKPIPPLFWGVGDPNVFSIGKKREWNWTSKESIVRDLGFNCLRGPCGTGANYYLWKEGTVLNSKDPRYTMQYGEDTIPAVEHTFLEKGYPPLYISDIFEMPNDLNLPYVFVVNVESQSAKEIAEEIQVMKQVSKRPFLIELGNELYASANRHAFPKANDYLNKVMEITKAVRTIDASIPISVVAVGQELQDRVMSSNAGRNKEAEMVDWESSSAGRIGNWNTILASQPEFYDAVSVHHYMPVQSLANFSPESFMAYGFAYNLLVLEGLKKQASLFPGKPFWVTEWNILPSVMLSAKDPKEKNRMQFMKTPGVAIFNMERVLRYLESGVVTLSNYHCLSTPMGFGIVQSKIRSGNDLEPLPVYDTFKKLGNLFRNNSHYYPVRFVSGGTKNVKVRFTLNQFVQLPDVSAWAFGNEKGPRQIVIINHTAHAVDVGLKSMKVEICWVYGGGDALPDFKNNQTDWLDLPKEHPMPITESQPAAEKLILAPYSVVAGALLSE